MLFDVDSTLAALEKPQLKFNGETATGKPLSWQEMLGFGKDLDELLARSAPDQEFADYAVRLCNAMELPGEWLLKVPPHVAWQAVQSFLSVSRVGTNMKEALPSPTDTPSSPPGAEGN